MPLTTSTSFSLRGLFILEAPEEKKSPVIPGTRAAGIIGERKRRPDHPGKAGITMIISPSH
jgi:hypothetical protein